MKQFDRGEYNTSLYLNRNYIFRSIYIKKEESVGIFHDKGIIMDNLIV